MGKGAGSKRMVAVRNYSTNIIREKRKQRGRVKNMEISGIK